LSNSNFSEKDQLVLPGDKLGTIEEGFPGIGTFEENGTIRAAFVGKLFIDRNQRKFNVFSLAKLPPYPFKGSVVIAEVTSVQGNLATLDIFMVDNHFTTRGFLGLLHTSKVARGFERDLRRAIKPGDIVRCNVEGVEGIVFLSMKGGFFGVVEARCSSCGGFLERIKGNKLRCENCGKIEVRLLASDYGMLRVNRI